MAQTMLSDAELKRLDDWAWKRRLTRSEALRQLTERGFTVPDEAPEPAPKKRREPAPTEPAKTTMKRKAKP